MSLIKKTLIIVTFGIILCVGAVFLVVLQDLNTVRIRDGEVEKIKINKTLAIIKTSKDIKIIKEEKYKSKLLDNSMKFSEDVEMKKGLYIENKNGYVYIPENVDNLVNNYLELYYTDGTIIKGILYNSLLDYTLVENKSIDFNYEGSYSSSLQIGNKRMSEYRLW